MPTHFAFGLLNSPNDVGLMNDMRTHNGTAWDFRYQYLAGGVNTGQGWETWASPSGQFAANYLAESAGNGYTPALVYYDLLQSNGPCGQCTESQRDLAHLGDPHVMAAYYANWRLLMRTIAASNTAALVIVEPDLWGYIQLAATAGGGSGASVPASVANSGDPDTTGLPNTAQGFAWALLHVRDRYAPHAVLALHVSGWGTATDIGTSTDALLDVEGIARATAQFCRSVGLGGNSNGISTWDLLSNDVADHDSGQGATWWDRNNVLFPNFARYLKFISVLTATAGRRVVMWQVPEGNQYFATMNDSHHHTQDNRAEYILAHVLDFARAGVVAVLFGPGNDGTTVDDAAHDGVANFPPISDFECDRCNVHLSSYPDDDGGYLRLFVGAYYRAGALALANTIAAWTPSVPQDVPTVTPLPAGTCVSTPHATIGQVSVTPNPAAPGVTITVSAHITLSCNASAAVEADIHENGPKVIILKIPDNSELFTGGTTRVIDLTAVLPSTAMVGSHSIDVGVFDTGYTKLYGFAGSALILQVQP
jgi:DNA-binding transcriptional regulator YdaS (Cro superfamily)